MPKQREHAIDFDADERIWRRVEKQDVRGETIKPNKLRLQISVCRGRFTADPLHVTFDKWNGVAEAIARTLVIRQNGIDVVCVDDPGPSAPGRVDGDGHALVAFTAEPGKSISAEDVNAVRAAVAAQFRVIVQPT